MSLVAQNINRLYHLLALFKLSKDEFLDILNKDEGKKINEENVFGSFIKISVLNKIDKIFKKGIAYYADPSNPESSIDESIFFRKESFNSDLNLRSKQIVNKYEEEKLNFDTLLKLSDLENDRLLKSFTISDNPVECAKYVRNLLYPTEKTQTKQFLKNLIAKLAENNILVFEFVESPLRNEPANISGFYLTPNVIVLKWQKYTKREVFTLAHEIGHYLLNEEDIDEKSYSDGFTESINDVEKWCNDFAFSFLAGVHLNTINAFDIASSTNDFYHDTIQEISDSTHLSTLAIYTHLLYNKKISLTNYRVISSNIAAAIKDEEVEYKRLLEEKKAQDALLGRKPGGAAVKAILSPLYIQTLQVALYNGIVDEYEFCRKLSIKPNKIENYLV